MRQGDVQAGKDSGNPKPRGTDRDNSQLSQTIQMESSIELDRSETFHQNIWIEAFEETGISLDFYTLRERSTDELLPWDFIDAGVSKDFLKREWKNAREEKVTPNCRQQCFGCGARKYKGGVCVEGQD